MLEREVEPIKKEAKKASIDVGVKHFLTNSDGRQVKNPKFYEKTLERIRVL